MEYVNVAPSIGAVVSSRLASLHELDTIYGVADVYDMLEILAVDGYNQSVANSSGGA